MLGITSESAQVIVAAIAAVGAFGSAWLVIWSKKSNTVEHGGTMDALQQVISTQARVEHKVDNLAVVLSKHGEELGSHLGWHRGHGDGGA